MSWYNNWKYRKKITIANTQISANLSDFPIYIDLSDLGTDFFSNVNIGGGDIRITKADGVTELARELVSISNELEATSGTWNSGADTVETIPANTDGEIFFTVKDDKNYNPNYFVGGFSDEADTPAAGFTNINFGIYGSPNASLQVFENGTQVHNTGSALAVGDIVSVNRNGSTGVVTYKLNGTTFYTSATTTTAELKGDITVYNSDDYISNIRLFDGTRTFYPTFDNLVNMTYLQIGELHFKADALDSTTDTEFYIYYGNTAESDYAVTDTYGRNNVFANFVAVYHLNQETNQTIIDSTGKADLSTTGMNYTDLKETKINKGLNFDGTDNAVYEVPINNNYPKNRLTTNYTISSWVNPSSSQNAYANILRKHAAISGGYGIEQNGTNTNQFYCFHVATDNSTFGTTATTTLTANTWQKFDCIFDGTFIKHKLNNVQTASATSNPIFPPGATNSQFVIGRQSNTSARYFNGFLDEIRISSIARDDAWLSAEYSNQNIPSNFYSISAQEKLLLITSISPAHESTGNAVDTNLVITYDDNVTAGTGSLTVTQRDGLIIGDGFAGKIGEMILTNENLSQDTIEKVEGYLAWKWFGINNPLPDSHPYKLRRPVI